EAARAHAAGDEVRTVIAGYHWFTDWGRDTMISLEGLTLITGRLLEAGYILRRFAHYVRDGLIPNMFPDGAKEGKYNTADATLWYNALRLLANWLRENGDDASAQTYDEHAERALVSFNNRFWYSEGGYLYDVVDVDGGNKNDSSCRPNQLFAISLDHPVLDAKH